MAAWPLSARAFYAPVLHHGEVTKEANFYDHGRETGGARVLR
jgi:hypothetical protein